jgi:hypothetical protein
MSSESNLNQTKDVIIENQQQPVLEEMISQRITIAKSLSLVTNLIRADPEIITNLQKQQLKSVLNSIINLDESASTYQKD